MLLTFPISELTSRIFSNSVLFQPKSLLFILYTKGIRKHNFTHLLFGTITFEVILICLFSLTWLWSLFQLFDIHFFLQLFSVPNPFRPKTAWTTWSCSLEWTYHRIEIYFFFTYWNYTVSPTFQQPSIFSSIVLLSPHPIFLYYFWCPAFFIGFSLWTSSKSAFLAKFFLLNLNNYQSITILFVNSGFNQVLFLCKKCL